MLRHEEHLNQRLFGAAPGDGILAFVFRHGLQCFGGLAQHALKIDAFKIVQRGSHQQAGHVCLEPEQSGLKPSEALLKFGPCRQRQGALDIQPKQQDGEIGT